VGLVVFGAGVLQPVLTAAGSVNWWWVALSAILHVMAHAAIRMIRAE
jgi:hypothetical protein